LNLNNFHQSQIKSKIKKIKNEVLELQNEALELQSRPIAASSDEPELNQKGKEVLELANMINSPHPERAHESNIFKENAADEIESDRPTCLEVEL
jgi:hypothetical protein